MRRTPMRYSQLAGRVSGLPERGRRTGLPGAAARLAWSKPRRQSGCGSVFFYLSRQSTERIREQGPRLPNLIFLQLRPCATRERVTNALNQPRMLRAGRR